MSSNKIQKSIGWSLFSEIAVKFVVPITNMILARVLTPDAFGVVAVCNMLVSFVDLITDAGFGKYIVQHDFKNEQDKENYINVSFWTNLGISVVMTCLIIIFRVQMATMLGHRKYATVISVASIQLIITSISSTQTAIFRRNFEFRKLFIARISVALAPLIITVPLAIMLKTYWALVIGNLCGALVNSIVLSVFSNWRPSFYYNFDLLKRMFSYSFWSLCEALANWTIFWVDTFIVGNNFSEYQLGLYKNSTNMVQSIMGMISASMSPVLLTTLSRLKNDSEKYKKAFLNIHSLMIYLVIPMGIGLFLYRKTATLLLFGSKWGEASNIVGAWGLMMMCSVIFYSFPAELYKSKGIPQMLFLSQCIYLLFMIPICTVTAKVGFWTMVYARCGAIMVQMVIGIVFMIKFFKISLKDYIKSFLYPVAASIVMILISEITGLLLKGMAGDFIGILICALGYLAFVYFVAKDQLLTIIQTIKKEKI